jgi:hypothetical protein
MKNRRDDYVIWSISFNTNMRMCFRQNIYWKDRTAKTFVCKTCCCNVKNCTEWIFSQFYNLHSMHCHYGYTTAITPIHPACYFKFVLCLICNVWWKENTQTKKKSEHFIPRKSKNVAFSVNKNLRIIFNITFFIFYIWRWQRKEEKRIKSFVLIIVIKRSSTQQQISLKKNYFILYFNPSIGSILLLHILLMKNSFLSIIISCFK